MQRSLPSSSSHQRVCRGTIVTSTPCITIIIHEARNGYALSGTPDIHVATLIITIIPYMYYVRISENIYTFQQRNDKAVSEVPHTPQKKVPMSSRQDWCWASYWISPRHSSVIATLSAENCEAALVIYSSATYDVHLPFAGNETVSVTTKLSRIRHGSLQPSAPIWNLASFIALIIPHWAVVVFQGIAAVDLQEMNDDSLVLGGDHAYHPIFML